MENGQQSLWVILGITGEVLNGHVLKITTPQPPSQLCFFP